MYLENQLREHRSTAASRELQGLLATASFKSEPSNPYSVHDGNE